MKGEFTLHNTNFPTFAEKTKVTENLFNKVLISAVCTILLCITCLVGSTWAWFTVQVDNHENIIWIAKPTVDIMLTDATDSSTIGLNSEDCGIILPEGSYSMSFLLKEAASGPDDLNRHQNALYVIMTVTHNSDVESYYLTFTGKSDESKQLTNLRIVATEAAISFSVSWVQPASATPISSTAIVIG